MQLSLILDELSSMPLFRGFSKDHLLKVFSDAPYSLRRIPKEAVLHMQSEPCGTLDLVVRGKVSLRSMDEHGNTLSVTTLGPRGMLGAGLLFASDNRYPISSTAESTILLLQLPKETVLTLCLLDTNFIMTLLQEVSDRTMALAGRMHAIAYRTIRENLVDFLRHEFESQKSTVIHLPTSKKVLSERFGIQRQSLSRELHKMRREGLLDYDAKQISLKDPLMKLFLR